MRTQMMLPRKNFIQPVTFFLNKVGGNRSLLAKDIGKGLSKKWLDNNGGLYFY